MGDVMMLSTEQIEFLSLLRHISITGFCCKGYVKNVFPCGSLTRESRKGKEEM
jgi:hypothetical protein